MPPPAPSPDPSTAPVLNQLTPELLQAMEKWFSNRIKVGGERPDSVLVWDQTSDYVFLSDPVSLECVCIFIVFIYKSVQISECVSVYQEHDALRLSDADSGRPMADKMADFALETQGQEQLPVTVTSDFSLTHRVVHCCSTLN